MKIDLHQFRHTIKARALFSFTLPVLLTGICFTITVICGSEVLAQRLPNEASVAKMMDAAIKKTDIPAVVAIAVNKKGSQITFTHGKAIWAGPEDVTKTDIFRIYSMTKMITSIAAMQLVEQGKLKLDEDLSILLPDMAKIPILQDGKLVAAKRRITLRNLLTHTSGFGYPSTDAELSKFDRSKWEYRDLPRRYEAGTKFLYGTSIDWVGRLVEKISGLSLEEYFAKNIFKPLGMHRTFFVVPDSLKAHIVSYGNRGDDGRQPLTENPIRIPVAPPKEFSGGGGLFSTPADYTRLLQCVLNGGSLNGVRILKKSTIKKMAKSQTGTIDMNISKNYFDPGSCCNFNGLIRPEAKLGLGWLIEGTNLPSGPKAGTVTWGGLANTYFFIDFKSGIAASFYTQYLPFNDPQATGLFDVFRREIYGVK